MWFSERPAVSLAVTCSVMFSFIPTKWLIAVIKKKKSPSVEQLLWIDELNFSSGLFAAGRTRSGTLSWRETSEEKKMVGGGDAFV